VTIVVLSIALAACLGWIARDQLGPISLTRAGALLERCGRYPGERERQACWSTYLPAKCEQARRMSPEQIENALREDPDLWRCGR
jgi:hypothetical protein